LNDWWLCSIIIHIIYIYTIYMIFVHKINLNIIIEMLLNNYVQSARIHSHNFCVWLNLVVKCWSSFCCTLDTGSVVSNGSQYSAE